MACCGWVFFKRILPGRIQIKGILNNMLTNANPQKYIAEFNSQSNWQPLWKINFYNG
jgi:hypothetical protein